MSRKTAHSRSRRMVALTTGDSRPVQRFVKIRQGIQRNPRERFAATLDLTDAQAEVLAELSVDRPTSPAEIDRRLGSPRDGVVASLYCLADRGLARREPRKGWVAL